MIVGVRLNFVVGMIMKMFVYTNLDECKRIKAQYESQYSDRDWDIYEIEIK